MQNLFFELQALLSSIYGEWKKKKKKKKFGKYAYGEIANQMCISNSQLTKLLYDSVSEIESDFLNHFYINSKGWRSLWTKGCKN